MVLCFYGLALRKAAAIIGIRHEALRKRYLLRGLGESVVENVIGIASYRLVT
ncbi:hypothetical protein [Pseudothermotoga thermarum]|uniref:Uncharacterized protein n=1 Tax=Pseudothermotoga thermarum DSM 5069 TaxID=688269 RepID=F7YVK8_9THEM|nr:hypothetical protein [Pseudothermotoga thermarum]AEH51664.1 hypothetical protein Theth_1613 [Pseudothermotoga thermarum DSM 5069]